MINIYRGDSWTFEFQILDYNDNPLDVTDWEIRAEITNIKNQSIKKGNSKVVGGSDSQIKILDTKGNIQINFFKTETQSIEIGEIDLEVEITLSSENKRYTVVRETYFVNKDIIRWKDK